MLLGNVGSNPVLDELDSISPRAKTALADAHSKIVALNAAPTGPAPAAPSGGAPIAPAPQPKIQPLGPPQSTGAIQPLAQPSPTVAADRAELQRLTSTGSGVSQVKNPFLRTLGTIGDAIGTGLFPRIASVIPGTTAHHEQLVGEATGQLKNDEGVEAAASKNQLEGAQAAEQASLPQFHQAQAENTALKNTLQGEKQKETEQHHKDQIDQQLRQHGFKHDDAGNVVPLEYSEMSEQQQAVHDYNVSRQEMNSATAELRKAQKANIPAQIQMAQARIANAQHNSSIAERRLALSERQQEMRAHGTENGAPLPGSLMDDQGETIGTANAANVRPTMNARNAAERAESMMGLDARIRKALQNPEITSRVGPLSGRLAEIENEAGTLPHDLAELKNDLVSYGAFQAGLHPVRGIGALQYFDKVMGGLGQDPAQLIGKLDSNKATAQDVQKVGTPHTAKGGGSGIPTVTSKEQYDNLPKGAEFIEDGKKYRKP